MTVTTERPNVVRWLLDPRAAAGPGDAADDLAAALPLLGGLRGEHVVEARRFAAQVAGGYGPDHPTGHQDVLALLAARALGVTVVEMSPGDARPDGMFFLTGCWDPPVGVGEVLVGSVLGPSGDGIGTAEGVVVMVAVAVGRDGHAVYCQSVELAGRRSAREEVARAVSRSEWTGRRLRREFAGEVERAWAGHVVHPSGSSCPNMS